MCRDVAIEHVGRELTAIVTTVAATVAVLLAPFALLVNAMPIQRFMLHAVGTISGAAARFGENEALQRVRNLLWYLAFRTPLPDDGFYSTIERIHLTDVRTLFQTVYWSACVSLCICVACVVAVGRAHRSRLRSAVRSGCIAVLLVVAILGTAMILIGFDRLFTLFHETFFANDYWLLPADSGLIRLFPASYFLGYFVLALSVSVLLAAVLAVSMRPAKTGRL